MVIDSCVSSWPTPNNEQITAAGASEASNKIYVAFRDLSICSLLAHTFSIGLDTKVKWSDKENIQLL